MVSSQFPVSLARSALAIIPAQALDRVVKIVLAKMQNRHSKLFANLARLPAATVHLNPNDTPFSFGLRLGPCSEPFYLLGAEEPCQASVTGTLEALIDMLEGRVDGDTLFFSRDIVVTGDTEIIVGLRNTLDREEICLMDEIVALCGPFAKPAGLALDFAGHLAGRVKTHLEQAHARMHSRMNGEGA